MRTVIFGVGKEGIKYFFDSGEEILAFVDNDLHKQGKKILDIEILPVEDLKDMNFNKIYIASVFHYEEMVKQLESLGINDRNHTIEIPTKKIIENYLDEFNYVYNKELYEKKWQEIKNKYKTINLYGLRVDGIGEVIARYAWIKDELKSSKNNGDVLNLFIPMSWSVKWVKNVCNFELFRLIGNNITLMKSSDVIFYQYVLREHKNEIDFIRVRNIEKYKHRKYVPSLLTNDELMTFSKSEKSEGNEQIRKMNLEKPYVCFAARTPEFNIQRIGTDLNYEFRNMDFLDYQQTIDYLTGRGINSVRMGREEKPLNELKNCVDYAGYYANDFMDLYLIKNSMVMVSSVSGIATIAGLFNRPCIIVNATLFTRSWGAIPYTVSDIYIPKKYFDTNKNRYLSLMEIIDIDRECSFDGNKYKEKGIAFVNNTTDEICDAVKEMLSRLNGTWQDTHQDIKNYERYLCIYDEMKKNSRNSENNYHGDPIPMRLATSYLRNNLYLLSEKING